MRDISFDRAYILEGAQRLFGMINTMDDSYLAIVLEDIDCNFPEWEGDAEVENNLLCLREALRMEQLFRVHDTKIPQ